MYNRNIEDPNGKLLYLNVFEQNICHEFPVDRKLSGKAVLNFFPRSNNSKAISPYHFFTY